MEGGYAKNGGTLTSGKKQAAGRKTRGIKWNKQTHHGRKNRRPVGKDNRHVFTVKNNECP